ncbi:hypothetical protein ACYZTM_29410 [Pseudomonas sp. MDT2-39-1]|uniref:hypothetical protein n=1 Tax=Pseudomonas sp. BGI-2 TaxID=2528211 RepID=UPI0013F4728E|nr:hypothetical protein [Pseudomonas sp. BGI-2]
MLTLEKVIAAATMYLFILACSGFHTAWISLLIVYFFEMDVFAARVVVIMCFVVVSGFGLKIMPKKLRKLDGK